MIVISKWKSSLYLNQNKAQKVICHVFGIWLFCCLLPHSIFALFPQSVRWEPQHNKSQTESQRFFVTGFSFSPALYNFHATIALSVSISQSSLRFLKRFTIAKPGRIWQGLPYGVSLACPLHNLSGFAYLLCDKNPYARTYTEMKQNRERSRQHENIVPGWQSPPFEAFQRWKKKRSKRYENIFHWV